MEGKRKLLKIIGVLFIILVIVGVLFFNLKQAKIGKENTEILEKEVQELKKELKEQQEKEEQQEKKNQEEKIEKENVHKDSEENDKNKDIGMKDISADKKSDGHTLYQNARFGFSIKHPSNFRPIFMPTNGDGIKLANEDESTILTTFGSNNVFENTPVSAYEEVVREHENISYKRQKDNWFVVSWTEEDTIFYQKSVVGEGSINTFIIEYPLREKERYDSIVSMLNKSFKTPGINRPH